MHKTKSEALFLCKGRTINDLGGARAKVVKKKLNGYSPGKKKTQLNNTEKKTQLPVGQEKKNST